MPPHSPSHMDRVSVMLTAAPRGRCVVHLRKHRRKIPCPRSHGQYVGFEPGKSDSNTTSAAAALGGGSVACPQSHDHLAVITNSNVPGPWDSSSTMAELGDLEPLSLNPHAVWVTVGPTSQGFHEDEVG